MRSKRTSRTALTAALTAVMLVGAATVALAGSLGSALWVTPTGEREVATFDFDTWLTSCVDQVEYRVWNDDDGQPGSVVVPELEVELPGDNPLTGSFNVPAGLEGGWYYLEIECETDDLNARNDDGIAPQDDGVISLVGEFGFARLLVTVEVEGDVPDDTTFEVTVECETFGTDVQPLLDNGFDDGEASSFSATREFEADGGGSAVMLYEGNAGLAFFSSDFNPAAGDIPADCTVTQTDDGGAESTTSDPTANSPVEISVDEPGDYTVTFTNTFPTEVEEEEEEPVEIDDEAEAAEPVEAEPDFTG